MYKIQIKKLLMIIAIFIVGSINVYSYAGYDDLVVMGLGCAVGGFWNPIVGGGQCSIWQPDNKGDCSVCNSNPLQECSEYQCRAIGDNCIFTEGQCVDATEGDIRSPRITDCKKISRYEEYQGNRRQAVHNDDQCQFGEIIKGKGVVATLVTNEPAKCSFDIERGVTYEDMVGDFDIFDEYSLSHYLVINPGEEATQEVISQCEDGGCRMFVKCSDTAGNKMPTDYAFVFEVKGAGSDITPPRIEFSNVEDGFDMKFGDHVLDLGMLVSDDSGIRECKYSRDNDLEFNEMTSIMNCIGSFPAACSTTLTNILDGIENTFYFRCSDTKGNVNGIGHRITINGGNELNVDITNPSNGGRVMRSDEIIVNTIEGADEGLAQCFYSWKTGAQFEFRDKQSLDSTFGTEHKQILDFLEIPEGVNSVNFDVKVECEDIAGNTNEGITNFELIGEDLTVTSAANVAVVNHNDISFSVNTNGGYNGDGKARCGLFKDNSEHNYGDSGMIALLTSDNIAHSFNGENIASGEHNWKVVCEDLSGRSKNSLGISFTVNTPALNININPTTGNLNSLMTNVILTTSNGIDNGNAKCKVLSAGDGFTENQHYDTYGNGILEDSNFNIQRTFSLPARSNSRFVDGENKYYFVCKDEAGKTVGQLVTYTIDLDDFNLGINVDIIDKDTQNPTMIITTTNGLSRNGNAQCWLDQCNGISSSKIGIMSQAIQSDSGYTRRVSFSDLDNRGYSCSVACSDDVNDESRSFSVDVPISEFTVNTPELRLNLVSPLDGQEYDKDELQLIIETFGGVKSGELNAGDASCYYTNHLVDGFRIGDIVDITKKTGISLRDWADLVCGSGSCKRDIGSGFRHTKSIGRNVNIGANTLYVQCKDSAGRLAPDDAPMRVDFEVK